VPGNSELAVHFSSYELAYRMQGCAPEAVGAERELEATHKLYDWIARLRSLSGGDA
jgi:hypothetical protein